MTPPLSVRLFGGVALLALVGAVVGWLAGVGEGPVAVAGALALVTAGLASASWGRSVTEHSVDHEERRQKGPRLQRRRFLIGLGAAGASALAAVVAVPAFLRSGAATERLLTTDWTAGTRLVTPSGDPIPAADIRPGSLVTALPEGRLQSARSQTVVLGVAPERVPDTPVGEEGAGVLAYSKLCTHMACPVGLYQEQTGTLVCPCHQAVFDVIHDGQVLKGPAGRALPRLPIQVDGDGFLVASGDFTDAVGTGFWGRP
jgi:ubiquinol-cytochrome c reductase iron-sulfur subunit